VCVSCLPWVALLENVPDSESAEDDAAINSFLDSIQARQDAQLENDIDLEAAQDAFLDCIQARPDAVLDKDIDGTFLVNHVNVVHCRSALALVQAKMIDFMESMTYLFVFFLLFWKSSKSFNSISLRVFLFNIRRL
jgi:hypothetical protein